MTDHIDTIAGMTVRLTKDTINPTAADFTRLGGRMLNPHEAHRVSLLEQEAPTIVERAANARVEISYLGIAPLFNTTRVYPGRQSDWALAPVDEYEHDVVPSPQRRALRRLHHQANLDFFLYAAHELHVEKTEELLGERTGPVILTRAEGAALVGPAPAPHGAVQLGEQLEERSNQLLSALAQGAATAGAVAGAVFVGLLAAPFIVPIAVIGALATLDPVILGTIPALEAEVGEPAAFFELVRWDW